MRTKAVIILIVVSFRFFAQQYVPMPMKNCVWQMSDINACFNQDAIPQNISSGLTYNLYPNGDTTIGQIKYVKFYKSNVWSSSAPACGIVTSTLSGYWGAVRQDSLGQKVYFISSMENNEKLLYNFNYVAGDTLKTFLGTYSPPQPGFGLFRIIDSVRYRSFNDGICRRRFYMKPMLVNNGYKLTESYYFTEGIGNEVGLAERHFSLFFGNLPHDSKFEQWTSFLTINNLVISTTESEECVGLGLGEKHLKHGLKIYPNPASTEIFVDLEESFNYYYIISDVCGKEIMKLSNPKLNISNLAEGVYSVKAVDTSTGQFYLSKFIKH